MVLGDVSHNNQPDSPEFTFARKMVETPKVVFSKTLDESRWNNTRLAKGDLVEEVTCLKNQAGKDMIVYGGAGFVSSLIQAGLIDEFNFFVNPVMINQGMRIFDSLDQRQALTLQQATAYECGIVVLTYQLRITPRVGGPGVWRGLYLSLSQSQPKELGGYGRLRLT